VLLSVVRVTTGFPGADGGVDEAVGAITKLRLAVIPALGVNTVTGTEPAVTMSAAAMAACICVLLITVVVRAAPFQRTTELGVKPLPFTVSVRPALPAAALLGARLATVGIGAAAGRPGIVSGVQA
jgi:hypothetical protein